MLYSNLISEQIVKSRYLWGEKINLLFAVAIFLAACNSSAPKEQTTNADSTKTQSTDTMHVFNLDTNKLKVGEVFYQCPMDMEEISDKPGACPKCGMDLEKMTKS